jgi:hypothetical protein
MSSFHSNSIENDQKLSQYVISDSPESCMKRRFYDAFVPWAESDGVIVETVAWTWQNSGVARFSRGRFSNNIATPRPRRTLRFFVRRGPLFERRAPSKDGEWRMRNEAQSQMGAASIAKPAGRCQWAASERP